MEEENTRRPLSTINGARDCPKQKAGERVSKRNEMKKCGDILKSLRESDKEDFFGHPILQDDTFFAPNYFDIIKEPMDLGTIQAHLDANEIDVEEFHRMISLVITNALTYNASSEHIVHKAALNLQAIYKEECKAKKEPPKNICVSLHNEFYKKTIAEHAQNIQVGNGLEDVAEALFTKLKNMGGNWLRLGNDGKSYVKANDSYAYEKIKRNLKECTNKGPKKKKSVPQNVAQASLLQRSDASNKYKKRKHQDVQVGAEPPAGANEKKRPERPHVRQDEEEEDKVFELIDLSAESPSKIKVEHTVDEPPKISESSSATSSSDTASSSSMFARPIFFQLYDEATKALDIAKQTNSEEAIEFYSHLKDFFVRKTDDEEFDVMSFDPAPINESVQSFGAILQRLSAAKAQGDGSSVGIYKLEIKTIMKKIKVLLPIKPEVPVKREEEGDSDEDSLF